MEPITKKGMCTKRLPALNDSTLVPQTTQFLEYVCLVEDFIGIATSMDWSRFEAIAKRVLDGQTNEVIRKTMTLGTRKETGAFFTGTKLSDELVSTLIEPLDTTSRILDPACGTGDLLIACSRLLPVESSLLDTLQAWGHQLYGVDICPDFVRATKARLTLAAAIRVGAIDEVNKAVLSDAFPGVRLGDGLNVGGDLASMTHIVLNPPYGYTSAPKSVEWSEGRVSTAAVFLDYVLDSCNAGTNVAAILPDVLRCGSRYEKWRERIEQRAEVKDLSLRGLFSSEADIAVFFLQALARGFVSDRAGVNWYLVKSPAKNLGCMATISVGSLVPHRHPSVGQLYPFLNARGLKGGNPIDVASIPKRRFSGTVHTPPFVAVRRTSRPDENPRASGVLVLGEEPVAVENHLFVVSPMNKSRSTCDLILKVLEDARSDLWFNKRMRCRHLTVTSLKELPWWA